MVLSIPEVVGGIMGRLVHQLATATEAIHRGIQHGAEPQSMWMSLDFTDGEVYVAPRLCKINLHE